jgi:hypothetical protein
MLKPKILSCALIAAASTLFAGHSFAAATPPAGEKLDKFLPSKVQGWKADPIDEIGDHTTAINRYYTGSGETQVNAQILRSRPNNMFGVPKLEEARLGQLPEGGGFASLVNLTDRKGLLTYDKQNQGGKLLMVAGKCSVTLDGSQVTEAQLVALGRTFDLKGLEAVCK